MYQFVRFMNLLKVIIVLSGVLVAATAMMFGPYFTAPSLKKCRQVTGLVTFWPASQMVSGKALPCHHLTVPDDPRGGKYLPWCPQFGRLPTLLTPDQPATLRIAPGEKNWIWQIEQNGKIIVSYDEIYASGWEYDKQDRMIGGSLCYVLFVVFLVVFRSSLFSNNPRPTEVTTLIPPSR